MPQNNTQTIRVIMILRKNKIEVKRWGIYILATEIFNALNINPSHMTDIFKPRVNGKVRPNDMDQKTSKLLTMLYNESLTFFRQ